MSAQYEFRIKGHLDDRWVSWFDGFILTRESDGTTTMRGVVPDQASLHGVIQKLRDLGMALISMRTLDGSADQRPETRTIILMCRDRSAPRRGSWTRPSVFTGHCND